MAVMSTFLLRLFHDFQLRRNASVEDPPLFRFVTIRIRSFKMQVWIQSAVGPYPGPFQYMLIYLFCERIFLS